jgi:adenylate cyclase
MPSWLTSGRDRSVLIGALSALAAVFAFVDSALHNSIRERAFDTLLTLRQPNAALPIIVDIDRASLRVHGAWPWSRERLSELVRRIADMQPQAIAIDILLEGDDTRSPAALARALNVRTRVPGLADLDLVDGDQHLAATLARIPTVLALALDSADQKPSLVTPPVIVVGRVDVQGFWQEPGLVGPPKLLADGAKGLGLAVMPGDPDGSVRRLPLYAISRGVVVPSLVAELIRLSKRSSMHRIIGSPLAANIGGTLLRIDDHAMVRLPPPRPSDYSDVVISAEAIMRGDPASLTRLTGVPVLLGSSAPEAGGLRPNSHGELVPSMAFHAAAFRQLQSGSIPRRPTGIWWVEFLATGIGGLAGGVAGAILAPWVAFAATLVGCIAWLAAAYTAFGVSHLLVDPVVVPLAMVLAYLSTALVSAAYSKHQETRLRNRFEQHLSPGVIAELIANPSALRLEGRQVVITALFTDVEDFTSLTERAAPTDLISLLDQYFDGVCRIVIANGGMVDKIVGDAVHAIFNAPIAVADHARVALDCAQEIEHFTNAFRQGALARTMGFGITRIGIETGAAIVGDIGGPRKLDYTAHGTAVNMAARLEAANKVFGTTIAVGPGAAAECRSGALRPVGRLQLRGISGEQPVFSIWPPQFTPADRAELCALFEIEKQGETLPIGRVADLADRHPDDKPLAILLEARRKNTSAPD